MSLSCSRALRRLCVTGLLALALPLSLPVLAATAQITGAGASFPFPLYATWATRYHNETGNIVNYQSIGSGGGIAQISIPTVDFGATDAPLDTNELNQRGLLQFPAVMGGVVPVVNLPGIEPGQLVLSGEDLADIYLGHITRWNDPRLQARNPELTLPDADILVVHRSDGSGTTNGFTDYLARYSDEWRDRVGVGKAVRWPAGQGGKGNEGVANYVRQLRHTIGYVEYGYARENHLSHAALLNRAGEVVQPDGESFAAAASSVDWHSEPSMGVLINDQPGAGAWPLVSATFILVPKVSRRPEGTRAALQFFDWALTQGQDDAERLYYVPLPPDVVALVREHWEALRDSHGSPLLPAVAGQ